MPAGMLKRAEAAAYGEKKEKRPEAKVSYGRNLASEEGFEGEGGTENRTTGLQKEFSPRIVKKKKPTVKKAKTREFRIGDSVMIYPDKKIGIVCQSENEKGVLQIQMPNKKIWINHKRVKLHVAAEELYPEDYDFSIIFDSVETRKLRHDMERKHMEGVALELTGAEAERAEMLGKKNK